MSDLREAVAALAAELEEYNPGHGDYLTAGRRLREILEQDEAPPPRNIHQRSGCVHSIGYCAVMHDEGYGAS